MGKLKGLLCLLLLPVVLHNHSGQLHQKIAKGIKKKRIRNIKEGMEHGNSHAVDIGSCPRFIDGKYDEHTNAEHNCANGIEHQMDDCRTLGSLMGSQTGQKRGYAGTDILSQGDKYRRAPVDQAVGRQRLQNTHRRGRALNQSRNRQTGQHTQNRIPAQYPEGLRENRRVPVRSNRAGHKAQSDKQYAETNENFTHIHDFFLFGKQQHKSSDSNQKRSEKFRLQERPPFAHGHQPGRHRGTDIGAHDDAHCLGQIHQTRIYKTDDHNRGRRAALNNCGHSGSYQNSHQTVPGQELQ